MNAARQLSPPKGFVKMKFPIPKYHIPTFAKIHVTGNEGPHMGISFNFGMKIAEIYQKFSNPPRSQWP